MYLTKVCFNNNSFSQNKQTNHEGGESMKKRLCRWSKNVLKAMIDQDLNRDELADGVHRSAQYLSAVVRQRVKSPETEALISDFLNIENDGKDVYE